MKKHTDPVGKQLVQLIQNELDPLEEALSKNNMIGVAKILRRIIPNAKNLLPRIKVEHLKNSMKNALASVEKLAETLESGSGTMWAFSNFVKLESNNLGGILRSLIDTVVDLVGDVSDVVVNVLDSLL